MGQIYRGNLRRDVRHDHPVLLVTVGETTYRTTDWSLGGVALVGVDPGLAVDQDVQGFLAAEPTPDRIVAFMATVVRVDPEAGLTALKFRDLSASGFAFLEGLLASAQRRRAMSDT